MSTNLTGLLALQITADDTYILRGVDAGYKKTLVTIEITWGSYNGTGITLKARPKGSAAAFKAIGYTNLATQAVATAAFTADALISVDATGLELALVGAGETLGTAATVDLCVVDQY